MIKQVRLARKAMATRWEIALFGQSERFLRGVAEEALDEVQRLERQLSLFISSSETSDLNAHAAHESVVVDPRFFNLLKRAIALSECTHGAFDITVSPLMRAWRLEGDTGHVPTEEEVLAALGSVGYQHIHLDASNCTVRFDNPGLRIDFGAIGKGYAIECAIDIVRDHGIQCGIMQAGTSTVYALGAPPGSDGWRIAVAVPPNAELAGLQPTLLLKDSALSVSAPHGKCFEANGTKYGHIVDPRTGHPIAKRLVAAVAVDMAADSDALSTALLTLGADWLPELSQLYSPMSALVVEEDSGLPRIETIGPAVRL